jgi:GNAT superfamily N-acetyltransferase
VAVVDRALVERIESFAARGGAELARALAETEPASGACAVGRAGGQVVYMGAGMYVNRAMGLGISTNATAGDVEFLVDFYAARGLDAEIEYCPYANDEFRAAATAMGFGLAWSRNVYVHDARRAVERSAATEGPPVRFEPVTAATYADWEAVCIETFGGSPDIARRFLAARHRAPDEHAWVASLDGVPVAVCSLSVADGVAELGGMGTREGVRGRGVQRACIEHRVVFARDAGCDLVLSNANPGGASARNLERAGFECVYTSAGLARPRDRDPGAPQAG